MRLHDHIGTARRQGQQACGIVVVILQLQRFQPGRDILLAPFEQDTLLIGADADDESESCRVLRLLDRADLAVRLDVDAVQALPIGGEIELLLALLGDTDIGDDGIVFARRQTQRSIDPGDRHEFQLQPETIGDGIGNIRIGTDHGLGIRCIGRERRSAGCDGNRERARRNELEILRDSRDCRPIPPDMNAARLLGAQIEGQIIGTGHAEGRQRRHHQNE